MTKAQMCLLSDNMAKECDTVPMYSRNQFQALVPKQIEIFHDDPLQLRHEFYSQNYKLETEGFAQALYKARVINTACALMRPQVLIEYADKLPLLPPYMDASLLDLATGLYTKMKGENAPGNEVKLAVEVTGSPISEGGKKALMSQSAKQTLPTQAASRPMSTALAS